MDKTEDYAQLRRQSWVSAPRLLPLLFGWFALFSLPLRNHFGPSLGCQTAETIVSEGGVEYGNASSLLNDTDNQLSTNPTRAHAVPASLRAPSRPSHLNFEAAHHLLARAFRLGAQCLSAPMHFTINVALHNKSNTNSWRGHQFNPRSFHAETEVRKRPRELVGTSFPCRVLTSVNIYIGLGKTPIIILQMFNRYILNIKQACKSMN